jgi:hypothetical protein
MPCNQKQFIEREFIMDIEKQDDELLTLNEKLVAYLKSDIMYHKITSDILRRDKCRAYLVAIVLGVTLCVSILAFSASTYSMMQEHAAQIQLFAKNEPGIIAAE